MEQCDGSQDVGYFLFFKKIKKGFFFLKDCVRNESNWLAQIGRQ